MLGRRRISARLARLWRLSRLRLLCVPCPPSFIPILIRSTKQHDLKRRETELSSALARLQRITSDPAQTKFIVLNPLHRSAPLPSRDGSEGELALLEEGLAESHEARVWAEGENRELRELVGEVEEWAEAVRELRGLAGDDEEIGDEVRSFSIRCLSRMLTP